MFKTKIYLKLLISLLLMAFIAPPLQADDVTVANGTATSYYVPIAGYYLKANNYSQVIYPSSMFSETELPGNQITGIKWYYGSAPGFVCDVIVNVGETTSETNASTTPLTGLTKVYEGSVTISGSEVSCEFDTPYPYDGTKNLVVEVKVKTATTTGSYVAAQGVAGASGSCMWFYNTGYYDSSNYGTFIPKTTFSYESTTLEDYAASVTPATADGLNFGSISVDDTETINVTLRNKGANAFTPNVTVSGTGFSTTYTGAEIASRANATIPVIFHPTTNGDFTGTITIDCGQAGTFTYNLTGSGVYELTVCRENTTTNNYLPVYGNWYDANQHNQMIYPESMLTSLVGKKITGLKFYPSSTISFYGGSVAVRLATTGTASFPTSGATLITDGIPETANGTIVPESGSTSFAIQFNEGQGFVYNGGNLVVDIQTTTYTSGQGGYGSTSFVAVAQSYASMYSYNNNQPSTQSYLPKATFTFEDSDAPATPRITANPTSVSGMEAVVGGTPATATVNVTGVNLTADIAADIVEENSPFSVSPASIAQSEGSANGSVTITYTPTAAGTHTGTLRLTSTDATTVDVPLSGTAVVPTITTSVSELTMNAVVGTPATATVTVTGSNLGGEIAVAASGDYFSVEPTTLPAAGGTVTVTYNPAAAGTHTGTITLSSTGAEDVTVNLSGTAEAANISGYVNPESLTFSCYEGQSATATISIKNNGNVAFTPVFTRIAAPFSIEAATEIAVGETKNFTVTFTPTGTGQSSGILTVGIGHTIDGTFIGNETNINLTGTAEEAPEGGELVVPAEVTIGNKYLTNISPVFATVQLKSAGRYVQTMYHASLLTDMAGKQITQIKFRAGNLQTVAAKVQVSIGETTNSDLSSNVAESTLKNVAEVDFSVATSEAGYMVVTFNSPYLYEGGNLVIQTKTTQSTNSSSLENFKFYGSSTYDLGLGNVTVVNTDCSVPTSPGSTYTNQYNKQFLPQATFTYEKARGVELVTPEDGVLNFGEVSVKGQKTKTITVKNNNSDAVEPSFSELTYPYSVSGPASIAAGETATISVTMAPNNDTENTDYNNVPLTLTFGEQTIAITINGTSHVNEPTMTTGDFAEITYTWVDEDGETQTSNLSQIATEPAQMVELMREVYMNRNVPGNWYRGYTSAGEPDIEVIYPPIGSIVYGDNGYDYSNAYGWNIGFSDNVTDHILTNTTYNYKYFNPNEYKPLKNGVTLLLVEMNDNIIHEDGTWDEIVANYTSNTKPATYEALCAMFGTIFKSVRVVTESRNMGAGEDAGTIFKLDADKLNRFFLLAKGRLRQFSLDVDRQKNSFINASSTSNSYRETEEVGPFYQMFEQLSPVDLGNVSNVTDVYQKLVNMESYGIEHDCQSIPFMSYDGVTGHEFNMYGKASISDDCQDVRDLMITIPERRMQWWYVSGGSGNSRDGVPTETLQNDMFESYNKQYVPKMGLFVIHQYEIEGEKQENANVYDLNLSWTSNLLEFLPTGYGVYKLYRVITNADGTKTYQIVADNLDPNTFSYVDHVEMQQTGQVVTYVVQGQDKEKFLSLQLSNERSFVIPGLDRREQLRIALNSDYYFSRYDAATKTNNYSNSLIANNTVGTNVKPNYLKNGSQFKFWRATLDENGEVVVPAEPFVIAEVSDYTETAGGTLTYKNWKEQTDFSGEKYGLGYHDNVTTSTISIENGEVKFDGLKLYDNFSVVIPDDNSHPAQYVYYVTLETAVSFPLNDEGTETSNQARSNTVSVPVYKTGMTMKPLSEEDIEGDVTHDLPAGTTFDVKARYSSKTEILGYYIYRWADTETAATARSIYEDNGDDASPQGQAGNQSTYYTVAMNSDYTGQTENFIMDANGNHPDVTASFEDNYLFKQAEKGDTYTYAPVVELFAPAEAVELPDGADREDYNTYGGPQQMSAGGVVNVEIMDPECSTFTWTADGKTYCYYNVFLDITKLDLHKDYKVAMVRAWRKIDSQYLGEEAGKGYTGRLSLDKNGEYKFVEAATCKEGDELGSNVIATLPNGGGNVCGGTFGALKLQGSETIPMEFTVRVYFTKNETTTTSAPRIKAEGDSKEYYIAEYTVKGNLTSDITTSIFGVESVKEVAGVKYYNMMGAESDRPFQGVNIVVTRYTDGTTSTSKVLK